MRSSPTHLIDTRCILPVIALASVLIGIPCHAGQPVRLTDADKAQIIRSVLNREIGRFKLLTVETILLLNSDGINQDCLPSIPNVEITLINTDEVKAKRAEADEFSYYFFSKLAVQGSKVMVWFGKYDERKRSSSSSGTIYRYRKFSGKWRGKPTGRFVTCAAPAQEDKENPVKQ
jgi:hypothetical protein